MVKKRKVFNWQVYVGLILILMGGLFLVDLFLPISLMATFWPLLIALFGFSFFIAMLAAGRRGSGLAIPGMVITTIGLLLFVQNTFGIWATWSYAWALIITAAGFGILIMNFYLKKVALRRVAGLLIGIGLTLFVIFGFLFEIVISISGANLASGIFLGGGLVLLGLFVAFSRLLFRRGKQSSGAASEAAPEVVEAPSEAVEPTPPPAEEGAPLIPPDKYFDIVDFHGVGELYITLGEAFALEVEGEGNFQEQVEIKVRNGELKIKNKAKVKDWTDPDQVGNLTPYRYHVTMQKVIQLELYGAASIYADKLEGKQINLVQSSVGEMVLKGLQYDTMMVALHGSGNLTCAGEIRYQGVAMRGAGDYHAEDLKSEEINIGLSCPGSAYVWAEKKLEATLYSTGSLYYKGEPELTQNVTSSGTINKLSIE